jgi:hypothetical protein
MILADSNMQCMCLLDSSIKFSASEDLKSITCCRYQLHESSGYVENPGNHFIVTKHLITAKEQQRWSVRNLESSFQVAYSFSQTCALSTAYPHIFVGGTGPPMWPRQHFLGIYQRRSEVASYSNWWIRCELPNWSTDIYIYNVAWRLGAVV